MKEEECENGIDRKTRERKERKEGKGGREGVVDGIRQTDSGQGRWRGDNQRYRLESRDEERQEK